MKIREVDPPALLKDESPTLRAFLMGECSVFLAREEGCWHVSIAHPDRYPTWDEIKEVRYAMMPGDITVAMLLPPKEVYVNVHENCFHLWEIDDPRSRIMHV